MRSSVPITADIVSHRSDPRATATVSRSMDLARRIAHLPGMHQLTTHPRVEPLAAAAIRSRLVQRSARFFLREALDRHVRGEYALREAPQVRVVLRHRTPDIETFDEVFVQRIYAAPVPVAQVLHALGRPPRIADLGANVGLFAAWATVCWPAAAITCFEPDPQNLDVLTRANAANGARWDVVAACAAPHDGEVAFAAGQFALSRMVDDDEGAATTRVAARDAFPALARADLVKIDIEGGEWPILADPRFAQLAARAVALEYHPEGCPEPDAGGAARALLRAAGFDRIERVVTAAPAGYGSLWAWKST
jgi:FkbM family methyltransferase